MLKRMFALIALALVVAACNGPATSSLTVTNLVPADDATGVAVDTVVSARFNLGIDVDTLDGAFTLTGGGETVEGAVAYDAGSRTATFTPEDDLAFGTLYTATVAGTVATADGVTLGGTASWSFTTVAEASNVLAFADPSVTEYEPWSGVASIGDDGEVTIEFPDFVNDDGDLTFTLIQDVGSANFLRSITTYEFDPPWDPGILVPAETYGLALDPELGTITGRTPFPGTYTGSVLLTDGTGATLEAPYEIVLEYTASYLGEITDIVVPPGDDAADPEDRFILVPGDRVTIAGANPLAFGGEPGGPTLITGTERTFQLNLTGGNGTPGIIEINGFNGTISVAELDVVPQATTQSWVYDVVVTHTESGQDVVAATFTFTLEAD